MNHQLYEDWLLSEEPLAPQETAALQQHLQGCESCSLLSVAWQEVEDQLQMAPTLAPAPGFTGRWQARLEADRQRLHRRQSLALLGFSMAGAFLLFSSLAIFALPLLESPNLLFWTWIYRILSLGFLVASLQDFAAILFQTATGTVSIVGLVLFAGLLSELGVLWIVSWRILTNPRRVTQ